MVDHVSVLLRITEGAGWDLTGKGGLLAAHAEDVVFLFGGRGQQRRLEAGECADCMDFR